VATTELVTEQVGVAQGRGSTRLQLRSASYEEAHTALHNLQLSRPYAKQKTHGGSASFRSGGGLVDAPG
jgi:hypothetical protein